jgi:microcystin degradation protein MlrC
MNHSSAAHQSESSNPRQGAESVTQRKRVVVAGLFHETHTFLDEATPLSRFDQRVGNELLTARDDGSPLSGVLQVADESDWELLPVIDLRATPSGIVEDAVLDHFWSHFRDVAGPVIAAGEIDGVYLVLHGAMVTRSVGDVEGEVLRRIRQLPGATDLPICGVLDLHGNISQDTIELSQGFVAYCCNPHTDSRDSAIRGAQLLDRILTTKKRPTGVWRQPAIVWPPTGTGTADDPMRTLETMAREIESRVPDIVAVNVFGGFAFADIAETGVSFSAFTFGNPDAAASELDRLVGWAIEHQHQGNHVDAPLASVLPQVQADIDAGRTPVILVEPADNIGGGAPGDTTTMLQTLLETGFSDCAVVINDPEAVASLQDSVVGSVVNVSVGAKLSSAFCTPVTLNGELLSKSDGRFDLEDRNSHLASMAGVHINMGPSAVVRAGNVTVLLTTRKTPPFDLGQLRSQGIIPEECAVIGVKAAVAHRRAYDSITGATYTVDTPGPCSSDLTKFPWQNVRRPVYPLDK